MNSDFFNINRFGRYLVTDIRNAIARYGISLLVMASISIAGYLLAGFFSMFLGQGWYSMNLVGRITLFVISAVVILISSPSKIYGFFTDHAGVNDGKDCFNGYSMLHCSPVRLPGHIPVIGPDSMSAGPFVRRIHNNGSQ